MTFLSQLQADRAALTDILATQRTASAEPMSVGLLLTWRIYIAILEDAITTLDSIITHLTAAP